MKDKTVIYVGIGLVIMVILTLAFYVLNTATITLNEIFPITIALVLVIFALYVFWDRMKNIRKGLPVKDERIMNISYKAGYYGFMAAIWTAVGPNVVISILFNLELTASHLTGIIVMVSGLVFAISYLLLARAGDKTLKEE